MKLILYNLNCLEIVKNSYVEVGSVCLFYFLLWLLHTRFHVSVVALMDVELILKCAAAFRALHCGHRGGIDFVNRCSLWHVEVRVSVLYRP